IFAGAFLLKILATSITLETGGSGGIVTPIFFVGSTSGAAVAPVFGIALDGARSGGTRGHAGGSGAHADCRRGDGDGTAACSRGCLRRPCGSHGVLDGRTP